MAHDADPIINNWYTHLDKGQRFQVVALAGEDGPVEIQYFDSTVEEIEREDWYQLDIEPAEEPENWTGSLDVVEVDDLGTEITETSREDWQEPLQEIRPESAKTDDDWDEGRPVEEPDEGER
jgi:hypothetical protein